MSIIRPTRAGAPTFVPDEPKGRMRALDLVVACAGLLLLATSGFLARDGLAVSERAVFEFVNSWPDVLYVMIWPFMQYGVFVTIPILVVVAIIVGRYRLAVAMTCAGLGVYFVAKWLKHEVERGRPGALLDGVHERESFATGSIGYPSGHIAVAAALSIVVTPTSVDAGSSFQPH